MAAAAPAVPALSTANAIPDGEDSNLSSPLSEVEDKDGEPDDPDAMALDDPEPHDAGSDSESNLSDANDTEAETERLYDTPQITRHKNVVLGQIDEDEATQETPTKQSTVVVADALQEEDESLSDVDISAPPSSLPDETRSPIKSPQSPSTDEKKLSSDAKKRKRSPVADQSDSEGPLRKRATSVVVPDRETSAKDIPIDSKTIKPRSVRSGSGASADTKDEKAVTPLGGASPAPEPVVTKKVTRNGSKQAKAAITNGAENRDDDVASVDEAETKGEGDAADADHDGDVDAAAKHDDEEGNEPRRMHFSQDLAMTLELTRRHAAEKKRIAIDEWGAIEEKFSIFRDRYVIARPVLRQRSRRRCGIDRRLMEMPCRLYKDRLEKLEREEQALTADVPYHPEYLNMKQCLDELHEKKIQTITKEHEYILEAYDRVAVARRAIIWGQFYQGIREARERMLSELNKSWHETQNARRSAHRAPDYGLLFPSTPAQRTRNAVAYNTEVSIVSGIAKHVGFPAAPPMQGASSGEIEEDLDAMQVSH